MSASCGISRSRGTPCGYHRSTDGVLSWNGGTEQQCRRLRDSIEASLQKHADECKANASAAKARAIKPVSNGMTRLERRRKRQENMDAMEEEARKMEDRPRGADGNNLDFRLDSIGNGCTCVQRGETAFENQAGSRVRSMKLNARNGKRSASNLSKNVKKTAK